MSLTLMAITAASLTHIIHVDHQGTRYDVGYSVRTETHVRTVGAATPNRMNGQRCQWTATVHVDRALTNSGALAKTIISDRSLNGSQPGACLTNQKQIEREIALRSGKLRDHLVATAEQDRPRLIAEIESISNLASR